MLAITISLLTLALIGVIFTAAFVRLWRFPPVIKFDLPLDVTLKLEVPDELMLRMQHVPADIESRKPVEEPIPIDILEYISLESDNWAQEARKRRVRALKADSGDWDVAFRLLQREDSPE